MKRLFLTLFTISAYIFINQSVSHCQIENTKDDSPFIATELLGRSTGNSVTINALANIDLDIYFEYGVAPSQYTDQTEPKRFPGTKPIEEIIDGLLPDMIYYYRMRYRRPDALDFETGQEHWFHTQRPGNSTFTFAVHADPHLDEQSDPEIYFKTLNNTLSDNPDFMIDLGDNFMSDKLPVINYEEIEARTLLLRDYYDRICCSIPLFLVIGNHEGELGWEMDGTENNMAVWATKARKLYYPNPVPDGFYTGSEKIEPFAGLCENYYAWEWGDALFVVIDPYRYTTSKPGKIYDNWGWTLGENQYNWFKKTLAESSAKFKFVFSHQIVGGGDFEGRGGAEFVDFYEMGGLNADSTWGFDEKRPGWELPLHQLMVKYNVSVFFHGHDHFFARQEADGLVYQLVPQPSHPNYKRAGQAEEYGYITGDILPNSGYLRVKVSPAKTTVDYVRTYLPEDENEQKGRINGIVDFSYTINAETGTGNVINTSGALPGNYDLAQNYPNPFNQSTIIEYTVPEESLVQLKIFDISGREVCALVNKVQPAGSYHVLFSPQQSGFISEISSGIYFYKIRIDSFTKTYRMLLLK